MASCSLGAIRTANCFAMNSTLTMLRKCVSEGTAPRIARPRTALFLPARKDLRARAIVSGCGLDSKCSRLGATAPNFVSDAAVRSVLQTIFALDRHSQESYAER